MTNTGDFLSSLASAMQELGFSSDVPIEDRLRWHPSL